MPSKTYPGFRRDEPTAIGRQIVTAADAAAVLLAIGTYSSETIDELIENIALTPGPQGEQGPPGTNGTNGTDGATGPAGPNSVSGSTATTLTGILRGDGANVGTVTIGSGLDFTGGTLSTTGGGLTGTGSTDNAILRADGTGGAALQSSSIIISDLLTGSPNNVVNHVCIEAIGASTNVSISVKPKGTGSFSLHAPDGTTTGGNARGANAVDLQTSRSAANQVASGDNSFAVGISNRVSGIGSSAIGVSNTVTANNSSAIGNTNSVTHGNSFATGTFAATRFVGCRVMANDSYDQQGAAQLIEGTDKAKTTGTTPVTWALTLASGNTYTLNILVSGVKSDGSAMAIYSRCVGVKNVGGTLTIVKNETIGTDHEDNASTDISITASSGALRISVTGISGETWRWQFACHGVEIKYGT